MAVATVPPFERFYEAHNGEVLAFLRRRAGRDRADDLFQETFLRALRAYAKLEHGEHLRAWVMTIAANTLVDAARPAFPRLATLAPFLLKASQSHAGERRWLTGETCGCGGVDPSVEAEGWLLLRPERRPVLSSIGAGGNERDARTGL